MTNLYGWVVVVGMDCGPRTRLGLGRHARLAAGAGGSTKNLSLLSSLFLRAVSFYCVYNILHKQALALALLTTQHNAVSSMPLCAFLPGSKAFIDSYHDFLPPSHRAVCPEAPSFDGSPRSAASSGRGLVGQVESRVGGVSLGEIK